MKILLGAISAIGVALLVALLFAGPTWYIWNHIVAIKFELPQLTFWDTFWTMLMIRFILPTPTTNSK